MENQNYKNGDEKLKMKKEKLEWIINIMESDKLEIEKVYYIHKIYPTPESLNKDFQLNLKFLNDDINFINLKNKIEEIVVKLNEYQEKGLYNVVRKMDRIKIDIKDYLNSEKIIKYYILNSNKLDDEIFESLNIDSKYFYNCVLIVEKFFPELYKQYFNIRKEHLKFNAILALDDISVGIRNGMIEDRKFDLLEFYKLIPFVYSKSNQNIYDETTYYDKDNNFKINFYYNRLSNFMKEINYRDTDLILDYMKKNDVYAVENMKESQLLSEYITPMKIVKNNESKIFTMEDAQKIIDYMKIQQLPFYKKIFLILQTKYLYENLDLSNNLNNDKTLHLN